MFSGMTPFMRPVLDCIKHNTVCNLSVTQAIFHVIHCNMDMNTSFCENEMRFDLAEQVAAKIPAITLQVHNYRVCMSTPDSVKFANVQNDFTQLSGS